MQQLSEKFNEMESSKKTNRLAMYLVTGFCAIVTVSSLALNYLSKRQVVDLVQVVDANSGRYLPAELQRREAVLNSGIKDHVHRSMYYANSFSRNTLKSNQAKTKFLMDEGDALNIFERYKKTKSYADAVQLGHLYEVTKVTLTHLDTKQEPFPFRVEATLEVTDGLRKELWTITGQGHIIYHDPIYPQNVPGLFITNYSQRYTKTNSTDE